MDIFIKSPTFQVDTAGRLIVSLRRRFVHPGLPPYEEDWTIGYNQEGEKEMAFNEDHQMDEWTGNWIGEPSWVLRAFDAKGRIVPCDEAALAAIYADFETMYSKWRAWDQSLFQSVDENGKPLLHSSVPWIP